MKSRSAAIAAHELVLRHLGKTRPAATWLAFSSLSLEPATGDPGGGLFFRFWSCAPVARWEIAAGEKMKKPQTDAERQLLFALVHMCEQYLTVPKEYRDRPLELEHKFMSAGEEAIELLAEYGLVDRLHGGGNWSEAAPAYRFPSESKI